MTHSVYVLVECLDCEFVFRSENGTDPKPRGWKSCPNCDGTSFDFT